ncbi:DUF6807 family protein [Desertihabitans aurantiacus]|uniref:DUF6807 family protein n=1 Tax=Desertihabitans aurantiacus TaxID=2282477 RepID=UPI000DF794E1|nr:DUF6807 family protein [Desertihabitans aurantiacus]
MLRRSGGPTITQVAEAAGVSRATVSRVLNGRTTVDPAIGARVRAAASMLDYHPNLTARSLSVGRTLTIAVMVPDLGNPLFQSILRGVTAAAEEQGYGVLVAEAPDRRREAAIAREARRRCDALVLVAPRMEEETLVQVTDQVAPVVLVNRPGQLPGVASIGIDYRRGMQLLAEHLLALGHEDLLYLGGHADSAVNRERVEALNALQTRHPRVRVRTQEAGATMTSGYAAAESVLESGATAVLAFNDLVAFGLLSRLNEFGVNVPADLSVTGVDGIELARFAVPSLTTISQGTEDLGRAVWTLLQDRVAAHHSADDADGTDPTAPVLLPPVLVEGDSTGRVPPSRLPEPLTVPGGAAASRREAARKPLGWTREGADWTLLHGGSLLAAAVTGAAMAPLHSPRPHLHPVRSLAGRAMTVTNPLDHRHHFGASLTVPDVNGTTYWGGRTYVEGRGPTLLNNHGRQEVLETTTEGNGTDLHQTVRWHSHDGSPLLLEDRRLAASALPEHDAWALSWRSRLQADSVEVQLTSPAVRGRLGAGYGGFFWRLPTTAETRLVVPGGVGEAVAHGSTAPFVVVQQRHGDGWCSLVLVQDEEGQGRIDPWFVRGADYVGVGTGLAWHEPLRIPLRGSVDVRVRAVVVDRAVEAADVPGLLAEIPPTGHDVA